MKKKKIEKAFLPVSKDEMVERGWYYYDFLVVTADAYIDHPSFGTAIIARVLEAEGYRVAVLAQPDWHSADAFRAMGRPRYGVMIGGGNIDSMVAHYTAAKKRRTQDLYSPGREAFGNIPIVVGGLEASLRRFAHYDYWDDKVRRALIFDAQADLLVYGMGEYATREIARRLSKGEKADALTDIRGTAFVTRTPEVCAFGHVECPSYEEVCGDKRAYALATKLEYEEHDPIRGKALWQAHGRDTLVVNPPAMPLSREELDEVAELPYMREVHPMYDALGGVPSGAHDHLALDRILRTRGRGLHPRPEVQGLRPRRRRPERQLPPPVVQGSAEARHVPQQELPRSLPLQKSRSRPLGICRAAASSSRDPRREEGLRPLGHPV